MRVEYNTLSSAKDPKEYKNFPKFRVKSLIIETLHYITVVQYGGVVLSKTRTIINGRMYHCTLSDPRGI